MKASDDHTIAVKYNGLREVREMIASFTSYTDVEKQIQAVVHQHFHQASFFADLRHGRYTWKQLRYFAVQYCHYSAHFPRVLGAAISAMEPLDDWWIPLADNLWDEAGRGRTGKSHAALYRTFLMSVDPDIVWDSRGFPASPQCSDAVRAAIDTFLRFFREATPLQAMAAVGFGSELFAGDVMGSIGDGLLHPNYNQERKLDVLFWKIHADEHEPHHYELCKTVLEKFASPGELQTMFDTGAYVAKSEAAMYDRLHAEMLQIAD